MGTINITTMWQILLYTSFKKLYYIGTDTMQTTFHVFHYTLTFFPLPPVTLQSARHSLTPQQAFTSLVYNQFFLYVNLYTDCHSKYQNFYHLDLQHVQNTPDSLTAQLSARKSFSWHHYCNTLVISLQWYGQTIFKGKDKMIKAIHLHVYNIM